MVRPFTMFVCFFAFALSAGAQAEDVSQQEQDNTAHEWLQQFEGKWNSESKAFGPDGEVIMECKGLCKSRMLGKLWVVNNMRSDVPGMEMDALQTIGYDVAKKKYVGTWIDSMMNHLWEYEGTYDKEKNKISLVAEGPNFMGDGEMATFRDSYEFKSPNLVIVTSEMQMEDGSWVTLCNGEMNRVEE